MQGIANERSLASALGGEFRAEGHDGAAAIEAGAPPVVTARERLDAAKRLLDGLSGLGWSIIGFLGGAVFWHFVGFWSFVSNVVLAGGPAVEAVPSASRHALRAEQPSGWVRMAEASVAPASCTSLFLDRRTGVTSARACEADHAPLPADTFQGREDRIIASDAVDDGAAGQGAAGGLGARDP